MLWSSFAPCRGGTIVLHTGLALLDARAAGAAAAHWSMSPARFDSSGDDALKAYLERDRPYDCCRIGQGRSALGIALFTRVASDDPTASIGLPADPPDRQRRSPKAFVRCEGRARRGRRGKLHATCCPTCSARSSRRRCFRPARWPSRGGCVISSSRRRKAARGRSSSRCSSEHAPLQHIAFAELERAHAGTRRGGAARAGPGGRGCRAAVGCRLCPACADPGAPLVAAAHRAGVAVVPLVGPSALLLALMASGMNGQNFVSSRLPARARRIARPRRCGRWTPRRQGSGATQLFIGDALSQRGDRGCRAGGLPATDAISFASPPT